MDMKILGGQVVLLCMVSVHLSAAAPKAAIEKKLYIVSTAHLDTQWEWTIQDTIQSYLPATLHGQMALMTANPDYRFSFEGAFRYALMKEYYPAEYQLLKGFAAGGQWLPTGSWMDAADVNMPSPESLFRQALYGNGFFRRELGRKSVDLFLPDCFGFSYALPSIAAHSGLKGFSTQKLLWYQGPVAIPFDEGVWEGPDGSTILAALRPNAYNSALDHDLCQDTGWTNRITKNGNLSGVYAGYKYIGVGDRGGAPTATTVQWLMDSVHDGSGPLTLLSAGGDQFFRDFPVDKLGNMPHYKGELLLTTHGTGCYTAQAAMKHWNRKNELGADAAERASVTAAWMGGASYPGELLTAAWSRFLWHQHHDDLTGTSIPQAYRFSWNDELLSLNQFGDVKRHALESVALAMDTAVTGKPVLVFNPLSFSREDLAELWVDFGSSAPLFVRVLDPGGKEVPAQVGARQGTRALVTFLARMPAMAFTIYDVQPASRASAGTGLGISESGLDNAYYHATLDGNGDVQSLFDKRQGRELLASSARLEMLADSSVTWPAWEIQYAAVSGAARAVAGAPKIEILERGPARVTLQVTRQAEGSTFIQRFHLAAGAAGDRFEIDNDIDWRTPGTLLKASFPLTVSNPLATYDLGLGTITRGNNSPTRYEVPAQQWADITAPTLNGGVAILTEDKYGWDKPADNQLRLSLIHTPSGNDLNSQESLDLGRHETAYAVAAHTGDFAGGQVVQRAARFNQPLEALQVASRALPGQIQPLAQAGTSAIPLARSFSFLSVSAPGVLVKALKRAEDSDRIVLRLQETTGAASAGVQVAFPLPILEASEINASEEPVGPAVFSGNHLVTDFRGYQPRTFAIRLAPLKPSLQPGESRPLALPFNLSVATERGKPGGRFSSDGASIAAELLPASLISRDVRFVLSPRGANALSCQGQSLALEPGYDQVYLLAAADGDSAGRFQLGVCSYDLTVPDWSAVIGQWGRGTESTFVKPQAVAWVGTHRHRPDGSDDPYVYSNLFRFALDIPTGATSLVLPGNDKIRILAATLYRRPRPGRLVPSW